ncbi:hypothetical protein AYJ54_20490 [Bradyrhizobium centrolobii]|uniref:Glycosyltransferase RgtA/B/C/D-like domain-containing protein n=1 Tax=Bradyrhizobium centrolobii TaxID=1505087 RepID=A0A176YHV9_9BRAD|nr:hypothetical protein [Bradyrhizobium centrolobii]OAF06225.1 hypothetical protein AYJ54_20490 [Bradyrhizobium centrolobii]
MDAREDWSHSRVDVAPTAFARYLSGSEIYVFLVSFLCVFYLSNASLLLSHYDLGWHLAAGDLIRDRGEVPFQDPWSFTLGEKRWYNLSWLWDVIASALYQYTGFGGLVILIVACGAIIAGYLAFCCLRSGASALAACIAVFSACLLYPCYEAAPNMYLAAAPNIATMLFSVIFYGECLRRRRWYLLPVMMVLWVNLHGGFVLGFPIIGVFCGAALLRRDWVNFRNYFFAGVGCLAAIFVNPLGWHIYDGVTATLGHFIQANIGEWRPYFHNMEIPGSIPGITYALTFVALELRYRGSTRVPLEPRLLAWLFLILGLYQFRYISFFFMFSTVPLALHIDRLLPKRLSGLQAQRALLAAGIIGVCALPLTFIQVRPALALPNMLSEEDARYLEAHASHARLLNHWNVGGYLIFRTHGSVPVFVDGRAATAYPDDLLRDYLKLVRWEIDETAWDAVIEKYKIDAVLWVKAHEELRRFLVDKRGWREDYTGAYESLYTKPRASSVPRQAGEAPSQ